MASNKKITKPNPLERTNCFSLLSWKWTFDLFKTGYTQDLGPEDLYTPLQTDKSSMLGDRLERQWNREVTEAQKRDRHLSLSKTLARTFAWEYIILALFHIFYEFVLRLSAPILLGGFLKYLKRKPASIYENALMFAAGIALTSAVSAVSQSQINFAAHHVGGKVRIAICSLVCRKALKLSLASLGSTAPGKIVNLIANDVNKFEEISPFVHHLWSAPISALITTCIIWYEVGWPGVAGMAVVILLVPIQTYFAKLSSKYRHQTAVKTDERVRLMDEIISGIQVIKMYAWEKPFCDLVKCARKFELKVVRKSSMIRGIYLVFKLFTTRMALYCTLMCMLLTNRKLTAHQVFVVSAYFNVIAQTMSVMFSRIIAEIAECLVGAERLQSFLLFEEFQIGNVTKMNQLMYCSRNPDITILRNDNFSVNLIGVSTKWSSQSQQAVLKNMNLSVEKGKLYCLIGKVGSGKTSLLLTLLGETNLIQGQIKIEGSISYASQEAWIFVASVRDNIIFGESFDQQKYNKVVKVCALQQDFEQFGDGDQTIVGEKGSSLSGGQKARINLARSIYRDADIYLLDDPLSAVDTHVGKHLFEKCLGQYLHGKTVILATHQLQHLTKVDKIIWINEGQIEVFRNYVDLVDNYPHYTSLLEPTNEQSNSEIISSDLSRKISDLSTCSTKEVESIINNRESDVKRIDHLFETTSKGKIKNVGLTYLDAGANIYVIIMLVFLFVLTQLFTSLNDYLIPGLIKAESYWTTVDNQLKTNSSDSQGNSILPITTYIYFYTILVFSIFFIGLARSTFFVAICIKSSQMIHEMAFKTLIQTKMKFFDTNPSGRILNRFSTDIRGIDELLPKAILDALQNFLQMIGILAIASIVDPMFLIPIAVLSTFFWWIRKIYNKTSRNIRRLEGITRAPVFTHLNVTLNGLSTIRAHEAQNTSIEKFDNYQDTHTSAWFEFITALCAFAFSIDVLCFILMNYTIFSFSVLKENFSEAEIGLAITQVMSLTIIMQYGMRQAAEVENQLISVEQVLEYTLLPPEPNLRDKGMSNKEKKSKPAVGEQFIEIPPTWPSRGCIEFQSVSVRYSEDCPAALDEFTLGIKSGEKVGIVGRTGAGKSSLISSLFRLVEIEGTIKIDDIDISLIALKDLRKHISIIPQNPVLFSGTIRRNLDPFDQFSDAELWDALEEVELKDAIMASGNGLGNYVLDKGSNYSVGQRQLVCLARAILRNNCILVLDEATANVDPHTDYLIQRTIRSKFAPCTVLTVAHRLNTIMDSDRVLVMDKGKLVEFDHPFNLLQNPNGYFTSLVRETGLAMHEQLFGIAKDLYFAESSKL